MKTYAFRLHPGEDLRESIDTFVSEKNIQAGAIVTCVGSLQKITIRLASAKEVRTYEGKFEIVSLVGTVENGNGHIHIAFSDEDGKTYGGHLKKDSIVETTAEIVIAELDNMQFTRVFDESTGYDELAIEEK